MIRRHIPIADAMYSYDLSQHFQQEALHQTWTHDKPRFAINAVEDLVPC